MSVPHEALDFERPGFFRQLQLRDWAYFALMAAVAVISLTFYGENMDRYDIGGLILAVGTSAWMGWFWRPWQAFSIIVGVLALFGIWLYGDSLAANETNFWLNYIGSGQAGVMWMSVFLYLSTVAYLMGLFSNSDFPARVGAAFAWVGAGAGAMALLVRWREIYLTDPTWGYIPVANLYEVFILFAALTALMYLYYEQRTGSRNMGAFVMLIIAASVTFLLWYMFTRDAHIVEPLVPALNSWWMKIHVPTNFVGYGGFAIAAMLGVAFLIRDRLERTRPDAAITQRMPTKETLDSVMYKSIAIGFAFFTLATVLGAMWAAEAWGGYWSWDPKETWALIVWLNYAAWLHMRFTKGWRGPTMAWWAIVGLFITTFAFLGVNMFLSGLHSYGEL
ncbi:MULTISPECIES: c-type cytochrome biogenesis protein CcsB [Thioalkalivibrio]|uniref:c-type cytochrome biogenesis protein CcsB n=1 Tax=Thioalkalivibrio TaxID=106633 RepID=UPI0003604E3B|nr:MULTISPECIES: c-type cytochrome biogenesis protein CcsB [Thioalkalivibrio]OOC50274.1 c-type cytochrome biogenesis protein CcsB [Thioalkalivibrio versutus]